MEIHLLSLRGIFPTGWGQFLEQPCDQTGLGYVRHISLCLTSSAVILVPFPIVLLPEVLLAVSAVPGVPGAPSAGSFSALF